MPYCEGREEAVLTHKFRDKKEEIVRFGNTPIEVTINQITQSGIDGADLNVYYYIYGTTTVVDLGREKNIHWKSRGRIKGALVNYEISQRSDNFYIELVFNLRSENEQRTLIIEIDGEGNEIGGNITTFPEWVRLIHVVPETPDPVYELKVFHASKLLYRTTGKSPYSFDVSCNGCPKGWLRCSSNNYPGYCCIPCNELQAQLIASRIAVRKLLNV